MRWVAVGVQSHPADRAFEINARFGQQALGGWRLVVFNTVPKMMPIMGIELRQALLRGNQRIDGVRVLAERM